MLFIEEAVLALLGTVDFSGSQPGGGELRRQ